MQPPNIRAGVGALAATMALGMSMAGAPVANAGEYIDFGVNQGACKAAAKQANATLQRYSYCFETGPGHYSLYLADY